MGRIFYLDAVNGNDENSGITPDAALKSLWSSPLGVTRLFMHALPDYNYLGKIVPATHAPNARDFANRMLTISNSLWLDDERFGKICQTLELAVGQNK